MDISGEHHLDVLHSVFKVRLSDDGQPIHEEAEEYQLGVPKEEEEGGKGEGMLKEETVLKDAKEEKCERYESQV